MFKRHNLGGGLEWTKAQCKSSQSLGRYVFVHKPKELRSKVG